MSRKVNLKAVAILLVSLLVLGGCTHLVRGYQIRRNAKALLTQADRAREDKDKGKEIRYLQAYLGLARGDQEVRVRYALLLHELARSTAQRERVYFLFESILRQEPDHAEVRRKAVGVAISLHRASDALFHLQALNEQAGGKDAEVLEAMGDAESQRRAWKKAAEWYAKAYQVDPKRVSSYFAHAVLLHKHLEKPKAAKTLIETTMCGANPNAPEAQIARARFARETRQNANEKAKVRESLDSMLEHHASTHPDLLLLAAAMDVETGTPDAINSARKLLRQGRTLHPEVVAFPLALARLELREKDGNRAEAVKILGGIVDKVLPRAADYLTLIELLIEAGEKEQAGKLVRAVRRDEDTAALVDYLEGRLAYADERWAEAVRLLDRARQERRLAEIRQSANLLLAHSHQRLGNPDRQLEAAQASLEYDPLWVRGLVARADALVALGKADEAISSLEAIKDRAPGARLAAARLLVARTAELPPERREWNRPLALLDGVPANLRDGPEGVGVELVELRARILKARGKEKDKEEAVETLEAGCKSHPKAVVLWLALADAVDDKGKDDKGKAVAGVLDRADKALGDRIELRLARAQLEARGGAAAAFQRHLAKAEKDAESRAAADKEHWLRGIGNVRLARGDLAGAERTFTRLSQLQPGNLRVWSVRFEIAALRADSDQLKTVVEKLKELEGEEGTLWRYGRALLATTSDKDPASARGWLAEVRKRRPNWGRPYALEGMLDEADRRPEKAAQNYRAALDRGERNPALIARLVKLLNRQRHYGEALAALAQLKADARSGELDRLATLTSLLNGEHDPSSALESASVKRAATNSKDPQDHLLRGRLLWAAKKNDQAEAAFRRAVELGPKQPECHLTLTSFLAEQSPKKVAAAIEQAKRQLPADVAPLVLAVCHQMAGQMEQADAHFEAALKARKDDPAVLRAVALSSLRRGNLSKANKYFRELIRVADPGTAAWARRTLALALAATGAYDGYREGLKLLEENSRDGGLGAEDQRARALVLARQPRDRREAIRALEASFARISPTPEEEFFLAVLLVADRDWRRANERFVRLLTSRNGANPAFIDYYVEQLIRRDELDKADHWVAQLAELEPDSLRTAASKARLAHAKKDSDEARRLLRASAATPRHAMDPASQAGLARLMESLGFHDDAEKGYRAFAALRASDARAGLPLIQFLGRRNRTREALQACAKVVGKVPDALFAEVSVGVLRDGEPTEAQEAQCQLVVGWLQEARKKSKDPAILDLALANVSDLRGKTDEAVSYYRGLLKRDDRNLLAHNNLAVLLALRERKHEDALASIQKALELAGPQPNLLDTKAIVLLAADRPRPAIEALEQATQMSPDAASYFRLAQAYLKTNNSRAAREAWLKAKAEGFTLNLLHPLERPDARKVLAKLGDES